MYWWPSELVMAAEWGIITAVFTGVSQQHITALFTAGGVWSDGAAQWGFTAVSHLGGKQVKTNSYSLSSRIMIMILIRVSCAVGLLNIQIYSGLDPADLIRGEIIDPASGEYTSIRRKKGENRPIPHLKKLMMLMFFMISQERHSRQPLNLPKEM